MRCGFTRQQHSLRAIVCKLSGNIPAETLPVLAGRTSNMAVSLMLVPPAFPVSLV